MNLQRLYASNRTRFLAAAKRNGYQNACYPISGRGIQGEKLSTDVISIGSPDATHAVVVTSGVHGPELPVGSLLQIMWMKAAREFCRSSRKARFIFVHALNPYGSSFGQRGDRHNVDLNRHFFAPGAQPVTPLEYHQLAQAFSPKTFECFPDALQTIRDFVKNNGEAALVRAVASGQSDYADGLFYCGTAPSAARDQWQTIIDKQIARPSLTKLTHVDIHTGFGNYAAFQLMVNAQPGDALHARTVGLVPENQWRSIQSNYADVASSIADSWPRAGLTGLEQVTPMSVEIGTIPPLQMLQILMERNTLKQRYKDLHTNAMPIVNRMRNAFTPCEPDWEIAARDNGSAFFTRLLGNLQQG